MTDFEIQRCGRKDQCETEIEQLLTQLAAAQAVIGEAVEMVDHWASYASGYYRKKWHFAGDLAFLRAADSTALHDRLRQERERCAKACDKIAEDVTYQRDSQGAAERCADAIRNMDSPGIQTHR